MGLTYKQSAVKLVVRVFKSGTIFYKTHAYISLLNATFVCSCLLIYSILKDMNGEGLLSMGFQYLSCITHAQLSKAANRIILNAKLAVLSDLVGGYGEHFFSAGVLLWGLTF